MSSSIPTARTNLITALTAAPGLAGVQVARSGAVDNSRETVIVLNATEIDREHRIGAGTTMESYVIPVRVEVLQAGRDLAAVEARMWQLMTAVEQAVFADSRLGGAVDSAAPAGIPDGESSGPVDDRSVGAGATVRVECFAVVSLR